MMSHFGTVSTLPPGFTLHGRYEVERVVGQGGMGIVYLATDNKLDGEPRAVKTVRPELLLDPRGAKLLREEAIAAQRLSHPNIVRVYHYDSWEGISYLVMEYVEWHTLGEQLLEKSVCSEEEFIDIARGMCDGLACAHEQGVIHQDIKPGNVFVDGSRVKLADFGVARVAKDTTTRLTGRTPSGTLVYMSPETLAGDKPTFRSDIYSLSIVFYEMLTGEPPFVRGDIFRQHQEIPPRPMDGVSQRLNSVILQGLEKEPTKRPASADEFRDLVCGKSEPMPVSGAAVVAPATKENAAELPRKEPVPTTGQIYNCSVCGVKIDALEDEFYRCPNCREYVCAKHYNTVQMTCQKCQRDESGLSRKLSSKKGWLTFWRIIYVVVLLAMFRSIFDLVEFVMDAVSTRGNSVKYAVTAGDFEYFVPVVIFLILANVLGFIGRKRRRTKKEIVELDEEIRKLPYER